MDISIVKLVKSANVNKSFSIQIWTACNCKAIVIMKTIG